MIELAIVFIVCVTVVMITMIIAWAYKTRIDQQDEMIILKGLADARPLEDQPIQKSLVDHSKVQEEVDRRKESEEPAAALPIDPKNPPRPMTFDASKPGPVPVCQCHGNPVEHGQRIIVWPVDDGRYYVFCAKDDA